jgi:3-polyprenyl-4-hydroxybenzoate decarboxylase
LGSRLRISKHHTINQRLWQDFELGKIPREVLRTRRFALLFEAIALSPTRAVCRALM